METAMQFLLRKIENGDFFHPKVIGEFIKYNLLEKEKEQIMEAHSDGALHTDWDENTSVIENAQDYYNETFNTKER